MFFTRKSCDNSQRCPPFFEVGGMVITEAMMIVPSPLEGEELYTQMGFFVQTILADRYFHRRELRLVSLESSSRGEYGIKKIFYFRFLQGVIEVQTSEKSRVNSGVFIHIFRKLC